MRSKEVDDAIMYIQDHLDFFITEKVNIERDLVETLLAYISELEKEVKEIEFDLISFYMSGFYDGEKKYKDKIRDKIKVLEGCIEEFKPQGYIEGELKAKIEVLKELLEGE